MADKSTRLLLNALSRAAAEPAGIALLAGKSEDGLFPATSYARLIADRCKSEGFLQVIRVENKGKQEREICVLTEKGREHLVRQASAREILEDFVRILEAREKDITQLAQSLNGMQQSLKGMQRTIEQFLPREIEPSAHVPSSPDQHAMNGTLNAHANPGLALERLICEVKMQLAEWHVSAGAATDCPLPQLYHRVAQNLQTTIGQFHDALRQLDEDEQIYLHPWTGPLYAMPEPAYALLVGHEIAYYASNR